MATSPFTRQHARVAPVLTALADQTRLTLITRLCEDGPQSISRLTVGTDLTRQAITKHLQVLSDAGLARSERSGREQLWRVEARRLSEVRRLLSRISSQWDEALARLREELE